MLGGGGAGTKRGHVLKFSPESAPVGSGSGMIFGDTVRGPSLEDASKQAQSSFNHASTKL